MVAKPRAQVPTTSLGRVGQAQVRDRSGRITEYAVRECD
jgi:hypothetical protein